jgi:hypothetical protein
LFFYTSFDATGSEALSPRARHFLSGATETRATILTLLALLASCFTHFASSLP